MDNNYIVNGWLKGLGTEAGIANLALNDNNLCAFQYGNDLEFIIELPPDSPILYMYSPMGSVPSENKEQLFERLLKANFFCLETHGATFSIDERSNRIILSYGHPIDQLDSLSFKNVVGNFLETAESWLTELEGTQGTVPASSESQGKDLEGNIGFKV